MEDLDKYSRKIASYCYAQAVLHSTSGNYCIYFDEIDDFFDLKKSIKEDIELQERVTNELIIFEGVAEVSYENDCFDITLFTDYMALDE